MNLHFSYLIDSLQDPAELNDEQMEQYAKCCESVHDLPSDEIAELLGAMRRHCAVNQPVREALLAPVLARLNVQQRQLREPMTEGVREQITFLYKELGESTTCQGSLLQWLATSAEVADLHVFVECAIAGPPNDSHAAALAFTPLFQSRDYDPTALFPKLFAALQHLSIAAPVLDLSNYLFRSGMVDQHPAAERGVELAGLLGRLVQQLAIIEENPGAAGESPQEVSKKVDECVALAVALCDGLALIGETTAIGKLYQALELRHRRIRTEATAALAKLGESAGVDELVKLAAEPVARLRVVAHAEELGVAEKIAEEYRTEEARAEAQVALELSQPAFFGVPPSSLTLVDSRTQFWPGFDEPIACYLFRYEYRFEDSLYSNVAIAGPLVHTFSADLSDLPPDDIYAAYAGWHVDDESVFEIPLDAPTLSQRAEAERFERRLRDDHYDAIQSLLLGYFFGDRALVARASSDGVVGIAVVDQAGIDWLPIRTRQHPLGAQEAFCIYKGRRLLRSFNG